MNKFVFILVVSMAFVCSCQENNVKEEQRAYFSVLRDGKEVEISTLEISGEGGAKDVNFTCCGSWSISSIPSPWLYVSPTHGTDGSTITINALVNNDKETRLDSVKVTYGENEAVLVVVQKGTWIDISKKELSFSSNANSDSLYIYSNVKWEISSLCDWVKTAEGQGDGCVVVSVSENASNLARKSAILVISDGYSIPINIEQNARYLDIEEQVVHFYSFGGRSETISIRTDGVFDVRCKEKWISFERTDSSIVIFAEENTTSYYRSTPLTIFLKDLSYGNIERTMYVQQEGDYKIDMNLPSGILWSICNVGAKSVEDYGYYYSWGELEPKNEYKWNNYKYCNGTRNSLTKYCNKVEYGFVDNKTTLESMDDVAFVEWGGKWRVPTIDNWNELFDQSNCIWTWTTQNGVNGFTITSVRNGNSFFLPAAGYCGGEIVSFLEGTHCVYWSSSLNKDSPDIAYLIDRKYLWDIYESTIGSRFAGLPIRPVWHP